MFQLFRQVFDSFRFLQSQRRRSRFPGFHFQIVRRHHSLRDDLSRRLGRLPSWHWRRFRFLQSPSRPRRWGTVNEWLQFRNARRSWISLFFFFGWNQVQFQYFFFRWLPNPIIWIIVSQKVVCRCLLSHFCFFFLSFGIFGTHTHTLA